MTDTQQAKQILADIKARHTDIMKLENSMRELHDMFMDLAILIESEGEMIDHIQSHVSSAREYIDDAVSRTNSAKENQQKARREQIMLIICLIIMVFVLIGVLICF